MRPPKLTVLLPVYQVAGLLDETFAGLAAQTEGDFEILAYYDASTDGTLEKLLEIKQREPRLRVFVKVRHLDDPIAIPSNGDVTKVVLPRGEFSGLNHGMRLGSSKFIAIHHSDDISLPDRFAAQIDWLEQHPEIGLLGTWAEEFGEKGVFPQHPTCDEEEIRAEFLIHGPVIHCTSMFRRSVILDPPVPFPEEFGQCADKGWQQRMLNRTRVTNLPRILYRKRFHPSGQVSSRDRTAVNGHLLRLARENLEMLGIHPTDQEAAYHRDWPTVERPMASYRWALRLIQANRRKGMFKEGALKKVLGTLWLSACRYHMPNRWLRALYFLLSPVSGWVKPGWGQRLHWVWRLWKKDYVLSIWFQK